jgi:hypothetical protein
MARAFKPTVSYTDENGKQKSFTLSTYAEVKKRMRAFMNDSFDENVNVYRHRRGEWGEWFEHWSRIGSKCKIYKQGWQ